jgi:hypothetical protein
MNVKCADTVAFLSYFLVLDDVILECTLCTFQLS